MRTITIAILFAITSFTSVGCQSTSSKLSLRTMAMENNANTPKVNRHVKKDRAEKSIDFNAFHQRLLSSNNVTHYSALE